MLPLTTKNFSIIAWMLVLQGRVLSLQHFSTSSSTRRGIPFLFPGASERNLHSLLSTDTTRMSTNSMRRSTRSQSFSSKMNNDTMKKNQPKKTPAKKKATAAKKPKTPAKTTKAPASNTIGPAGSKYVPTEGKPWYYMFTKGDEEYDKYMATEWGFEKRGTVLLFEKISLEGAQSGLSWLTVLRKRDAYRRVFHNFDVDKVAAMTQRDVERILSEEDKTNPRNIVVRHRGKIESVIQNAQCIQELQKLHPDNPDYFDEFIWSFVDNKPILNTQWHGESLERALSQSKESQAMSKALKSLGFRFVGPTTMYAMMQSSGLVIDHPVNSPEWIMARERLEKRNCGYQEQDKE